MSEPYIETVSGKKLTFLNPNPDDIVIEDIAYALSNQCRFNGHVPFYSVAQHSVLVSAKCFPSEKLAGLLHDAAEAYLSDIPSPIKQYLPDYQKMEHTLQTAINKKFEVNTFTDSVKSADKDATYTEAHFLLDSKGKDWIPIHFRAETKYKPIP